MSRVTTVVWSGFLIAFLLPASALAQPPSCRDARPTADRFARHLVHEWSLGKADEARLARTMRYHRCGRWRASRGRLWFSYSARDSLLGYVSWWVRASWHGARWHYYNRGLRVTLTPEMLDA